MENTKRKLQITLSVIFVVVLGVVAFLQRNNIKKSLWAEQVNANPDYICTKTIDNPTCEIEECEEWWQDWKRTCHGTKVLEVSYYHTRTTCEQGYSVTKKGSTSNSKTAARYADNESLKSNFEYGWGEWWSSWRHSSDYPSNTTSCTIVEIDDLPPEWDTEAK